jgi:hypothetical protein
MRWCLCFAVIGLGLLAGCTTRSVEEKYTPPESTARQALETALGQWRDGQAQPAQFPLGKVKVEVLDQNWLSGQKLQGFEIVGEESGAGPRIFTVKLKTSKGDQTVKYYVVGIDPLWVYSEADYKKQSGA